MTDTAEIIARAFCISLDVHLTCSIGDGETDCKCQGKMKRAAYDAIAALTEAGLAIVPVEPTAKQIEAFYRAAEMPIDPDDFTPVVTKAFKALIEAGK